MIGDERALQRAAERAGYGVNEYRDCLNAGYLFCSRCLAFHPADEFNRDASKMSGRKSACRASLRRQRREGD